jgi:hypothetical protein
MTFTIKATDTSGIVSLHRDTAMAARKKAKELMDEGCWNVEITDPQGRSHALHEFDAILAQSQN